jgi:hypothetical protein
MVYDEEELRTKMDAMHKKPKQSVQLYYDKLERLFVKGHILNVEKQIQFMAKLQPK